MTVCHPIRGPGRPALLINKLDPKVSVALRRTKRERLHDLGRDLSAQPGGRPFTLDDTIGYLLDFYMTYTP